MANGTLKVSNIQTSSGSGTITLGQSGETLSVPSGATLDMSNATTTLNSSMKNTPAFLVAQSSNQSIAAATQVELTWGTEYVDTDNAFASNRFTVPSGKAGLYCFTLTVQFNGTASGGGAGPGFRRFDSSDNPYTSGGGNADGTLNLSFGTNGFNMAVTYKMEVGDYVIAVVYQDNGTQTTYAPRTFFGGHKLIGA